MILRKNAAKLLLFLLLTPATCMSTAPELIAHRGASAYRPENTMEAFELAYQMGAHLFEFDVWLTKDEVAVVIHDEQLERTTNFKGSVHDYTLEELKKADAGTWFNGRYAFCQIPTLEEVLQFFEKKKVSLFVELKDPDTQICKKTAELINQYEMLDRACVISFEHHLLHWMCTHHPEVPLGFSSRDYDDNLIENALSLKAKGVMLLHSILTQERIEELKKNHLEVWTYTINNHDFASRPFFPQLSGYCSDYPDLKNKKIEDSLID